MHLPSCSSYLRPRGASSIHAVWPSPFPETLINALPFLDRPNLQAPIQRSNTLTNSSCVFCSVGASAILRTAGASDSTRNGCSRELRLTNSAGKRSNDRGRRCEATEKTAGVANVKGGAWIDGLNDLYKRSTLDQRYSAFFLFRLFRNDQDRLPSIYSTSDVHSSSQLLLLLLCGRLRAPVWPTPLRLTLA